MVSEIEQQMNALVDRIKLKEENAKKYKEACRLFKVLLIVRMLCFYFRSRRNMKRFVKRCDVKRVKSKRRLKRSNTKSSKRNKRSNKPEKKPRDWKQNSNKAILNSLPKARDLFASEIGVLRCLHSIEGSRVERSSIETRRTRIQCFRFRKVKKSASE